MPQIAGGIGAALLIIGSFLTWVTVSINIDKFAELLGIDPGLISGSGIDTTTTVSGTSGDGKFTLFFGVIALVGVILIAAVLTARKAGGVMLLLAGVAGALLCIWEVTTKDAQINDALNQSGDTLSQLGVTADAFKAVFSVAWGIGLWTCLVGGVLATIGGIMALMSSSSATPAMTGGMSPPMGTGFAPPAPAAPAAPMQPAAPVISEPAAMPPAEQMSPPTATDPMPGMPLDDEGGTTT
ncbi:MAG: hypothetical protein ABI572_08040 [Actinomycetota bacterium]